LYEPVVGQAQHAREQPRRFVSCAVGSVAESEASRPEAPFRVAQPVAQRSWSCCLDAGVGW
jgi:hypothetical protein